MVDTATVGRAFGATSGIAPCAKCARYAGVVDITGIVPRADGGYHRHRRSRLWRDVWHRPVRKMRTLRCDFGAGAAGGFGAVEGVVGVTHDLANVW